MSKLITNSIKHPNSSTDNIVLNADGSVIGVGLFSTYAIVADRKSLNEVSGVLTANTWNLRDLNTVVADKDSIITISTDEKGFELGTGSYLIKASAPSFNAQFSKIGILQDNVVIEEGTSTVSQASAGNISSFVAGRVVVTGSTSVIAIGHIAAATTTNKGGGHPSQTLGSYEQYTTVEIYKETE